MTSAQDYAKMADGIFVIPNSFMRIKELVDDEKSEIAEIAQTIALDPALTSAVLKLANSSFFNFSTKIDTINKAVALLGVSEIYNLVIAYFITGALKSANSDSSYLQKFWQDSIDCALFITFISKQMNIKNPERLYIMGLLHNIGELLMQRFNPDDFQSCSNIDIDNLPWQNQKSILGLTYAEVTAELLECWQLPVTLYDPVRQQNKEDIKGNYPEAKVLYIAKRLMLHKTYFNAAPIDRLLSKELLDSAGIDEEIITAANAYCDNERSTILSLLNL